ncbi:MAG TPA: carboxypeptidase M32 [Chitinophagaceae bacterium]|jgi:carboxypeptidase Taq|nr:carboxypeptidase M32 [Chitinophagaceae bacterium]
MPNPAYGQYQEKMRRIADIRNATALLQWDQETYLPPKGAAFRGQQISTLSELSHNLFTEEALGRLLQDLLAAGDLTPTERRNVELTWEDYEKQKKYSGAFVRALSDRTNKAFHSWIEARRANSFAGYAPDLGALIDLKKQEAELLGYEGHPYNALLNEFEKGATVALLDQTFGDLLPGLKDLLDRIARQPQVDDSLLFQHFPKDRQWEWGLFLLRELNFDFESGRQDLSEHPFSISFNPRDVRITTRVDEQDFSNMTWSCIHEVGHALYEQGLPEDQYGLPGGEACSYSIHESQSRLWENNVGRSRPFWNHYFSRLQAHFPEAFGEADAGAFYRAINKVQPSLIRTEADEITYHFHVFIRYSLEKKLLEGALDPADIPAFWNEQYRQWLGVTVPDDKRGSLQDVHWSHGSFGYFPTYSLGSFYAAQFFAAAGTALPGLENSIGAGKLQELLGWLRSGVHAKGRLQPSEELCRALTGGPLDVRFFVNYLLEKYGAIYNL